MAKAEAKRMVKKLSSRTVFGTPEAIRAAVSKDTPHADLYHVAGIARDTRTGESNFGPWTALVGSFESINVHTGERVLGNQAFLAEPFHTAVVEAIRTAKEQASKSAEESSLAKGESAAIAAQQAESAKRDVSLEFACTIGVDFDPDSKVGYQYTVTPVLQPRDNDPITSIFERAGLIEGERVKLLPGMGDGDSDPGIGGEGEGEPAKGSKGGKGGKGGKGRK